MIPGYQTLTEKEKQTLRLLLDGHDAKSMARHLGLSVHTINERLRDARRKLAVSSSKAAARLLRQAEGAPPETLGDSVFGDAEATPVDQQGTESRTAPRRSRRAVWAIGGFAMFALALALLALPQTEGQPTQAATAQAPADTPATRAARDFLALVDANNWPESYARTTASFQSLNTVAAWQSILPPPNTCARNSAPRSRAR